MCCMWGLNNKAFNIFFQFIHSCMVSTNMHTWPRRSKTRRHYCGLLTSSTTSSHQNALGQGHFGKSCTQWKTTIEVPWKYEVTTLVNHNKRRQFAFWNGSLFFFFLALLISDWMPPCCDRKLHYPTQHILSLCFSSTSSYRVIMEWVSRSKVQLTGGVVADCWSVVSVSQADRAAKMLSALSTLQSSV